MSKSQVALSLIALIISIAGVFITYREAQDVRQELVCRDWPSVIGIITKSQTKQLPPSQQSDSESLFIADVAVSYEIDNKSYSCTRISFHEITYKTATSTEEILKHYRLRTQVPVYYNPNNPANSILDPTIHWQEILLVAIGIILIVGPIGVIIYIFLNRAGSNNESIL